MRRTPQRADRHRSWAATWSSSCARLGLTAVAVTGLVVSSWSAELRRSPEQAAEETAREGLRLLEQFKPPAESAPDASASPTAGSSGLPSSPAPDREPSAVSASGDRTSSSTEQALHRPSWPTPPLTDLQRTLADQIAEESRRIVSTALPTPSPARSREGLWIALSWSMPDDAIQSYFDQARWLGATVVFRGVIDRSMRATAERVRTAFGERAEHAASIVIDPPLVRRCQIEAVPALLAVQGEHCWSVIGGADVERWLQEFARADGHWQPLVNWYRRQRPTLWDPKQPAYETRPALPPLSDDRHFVVPGDQWAWGEPDLEDAIREAVARVDWEAVRGQLIARAQAKLRAGPGLSVPPARQPRKRLVDPTVVLTEDVVEPTRRLVLAKAGTRLNTLTSLPLRQTILVLDGARDEQLAWADRWLASPTHGPTQVTIVMTRGDVTQLMPRWQRRVYWASAELLAKLGVEATPSLITQEGDRLSVEEVVVR